MTKRYKQAIQVPGSLDWAWAAGVYEGEGCVGYYQSLRTIRLCVAQNKPWLVRRFQRLFGGSIYKMKNQTLHGRSMYQWVLYGQNAKDWMVYIYPRLSPYRQRQAKRAKITAI